MFTTAKIFVQFWLLPNHHNYLSFTIIPKIAQFADQKLISVLVVFKKYVNDHLGHGFR